MPFAMEQLTQGLTVLAKLDPQSMNAGTDTSMTNIDLSKVRRLLLLLQTGSLGAAGTVDAKLRASKTSGGTYTDITGAAITQLTVGGSGGSKVCTIEVRDDQLETVVGAGYKFVQVSITVGGNAVLIGAVVLGAEAEYKPAKSQDIAAVAQRVVV